MKTLIVSIIAVIMAVLIPITNIYRNHRLEISYEEDEIIVFLNGHWYYADDYEENGNTITIDF